MEVTSTLIVDTNNHNKIQIIIHNDDDDLFYVPIWYVVVNRDNSVIVTAVNRIVKITSYINVNSILPKVNVLPFQKDVDKMEEIVIVDVKIVDNVLYNLDFTNFMSQV